MLFPTRTCSDVERLMTWLCWSKMISSETYSMLTLIKVNYIRCRSKITLKNSRKDFYSEVFLKEIQRINWTKNELTSHIFQWKFSQLKCYGRQRFLQNSTFFFKESSPTNSCSKKIRLILSWVLSYCHQLINKKK